MTQISGSLICVTEKPAAVSEVLVRAPKLRTSANAVVITEPDRYPVTNGQVSFPCAPGPAVLTLISSGMPEATVLPIVVADAASMSLQDAVVAAELVDTSTRSQLEQLAADAMRAVEAASEAAAAASAAKQSEMNAESSASSASGSAAAASNAAGTATTKASEASDAAASAIAAAASVAQFQGNGFPNGKVDAPVGSIYTDLDATAGAIRWVKTTGTGNTGWQVGYGDTGVRILPRPEIFSGGAVMLSRSGNYVNVVIHAATLASNLPAWQVFITLPPGFRPATNFRVQAQDAYLDVRSNGGIAQIATDLSAGKIVSFGAVYRTSNPWPTTLPGTPA